MRLKNNTPYMIRNDGKVLLCGDAHPYIIYEYSDVLSEIINNIIYGNSEWLPWFYKNTLQEATKKKIVQCVQYLSNIVLFNERSQNDDLDWLGTTSTLNNLLEKFNVKPKIISEVTASTLKTLEALFEELNNLTNQEFLRCRTGGEYWEEDSREIYFRVSSSDFNWFNIIWKLVYDNSREIENVTIEPDRQSGKDIGREYYVVGGELINHIPTEVFLTLKGRPIIEELETSDQRILKLRAGKSLVEAFGDFGPFHNNNKFNARRQAYLKEAFKSVGEEESMSIEQLLDELGITAVGAYGDNSTYTIDIMDSNEFGRFNSILDKSDLLEEVTESSYLTAENANLDYKFENQYLLSLIADFDEDTYKLVIIEME